MTIRIIRSPRPTELNLHAVEREEQILIIAKKMADASGDSTPERVDLCARKLRNIPSFVNQQSLLNMAESVSERLTKNHVSSIAMAHLDIDMDRILSLLEG